ncbi:hypothetical protein AQUCO_00600096v1, partial [Aquilegia coerulea]
TKGRRRRSEKEIREEEEEKMEGEGGGETEKSRKVKSCKGCLYHSTLRQSKSRDPLCVGFTRTLPKVPEHVVRDLEMEASKKGRPLSDFKFSCVGYSVYLDGKDSSADQTDKPVELPFCAGIQLVVDKIVSEADHGPVHANNEEDGDALPKPRPLKQPQSMGDGFLTRFTRNGSLVASGVSRNMHRMGRYIKDNVDDIFYERRRPK